ncbi:MAG: phage shock protein [Sphingomonadales bacterium]|jgi:phage shock protein B|nr:phage shock protein [Sphingomonadales bacterium]
MDSQPIFVVVMVIGILGILFIGLPWLIFHYVTRWKSQATLTNEDEKLLDELHDLARRLDDRMCSIERIMSAENPNWRAVACDPADTGIEALNAPTQPRRIGQ